jgi:cell division protein FtsI (penicillin-binding protein 3)
MAKVSARVSLLQVMLGLAALAVIVRAAQLQLVQGAQWRAEAERTRKEKVITPARRGGIYDRNGVALAVTQEYFGVGIAPNELANRSQDVRTIARALSRPLGDVQHDVATKKWVAYRGPFSGLEIQPLRGLRGVYPDGSYARHYPAGPLARGVIGALTPDGSAGASGVELALDSVLTGEPGVAVVLKDPGGRRYQSPGRIEREPVPGKDVYLTIDAELQEIAEGALDEAMAEFDAIGGDVVFLDPRTGELLALASRQTVDGKVVTNKASFFTDPFEPGSTAKLFAAAGLLRLGRAGPKDEVYAEQGVWEMAVDRRGDTRIIKDAHPVPGNLTLARAIQVSSNIAIGKFSARMSAVEQFETLRDFGFGSPTGVEYPSEARGSLRMPDRWDGYSKPSIAMGYEFTLTPVQLAAAYAAIANDGILLTPSLVREVHDLGGRVGYRHRPEPVRRAISPEVARTLIGYLTAVVEQGGTAEAAQLANYVLAGKTGTAVRHDGRAYQNGHYTASFASIFPANDPQLVVVVKIDDPKKGQYGGKTAAPVTRGMLEEALAADRSAIDRSRLTGPAAPLADAPDESADDSVPEGRRVIVALPLPPDSTTPRVRQLVPNVTGANLRRATNALHRRGFQVAVRGGGMVLRTTPAAGDSARTGSTVTVWAE